VTLLFDVLRCSQAGVVPVLARVSILADVFADSRLVCPPKSLLLKHPSMEARVGIEPSFLRG
jgi:hypothetical protein